MKRFWWAVIGGAVLVGILYGLPQFLIWKKLSSENKPYQVIQLTHHSDEAYGHIGFAREIYEGNLNNAPSLFSPFPIPYLVMAFFIWVFQGSINAAYTAIHFVVPAFLFILFVWLGLVMTGRRAWALAIGFVGTLTPIVNHVPDAFRSIGNFSNIVLKNFYPLVNTLLPDLFLSRTMDPLLTYLVFVPAIIALIIFWRSPSTKSGVWVGVGLGALYYTYFHYWVLMTIVFGFLGLIALVQRNKLPERWRAMLWAAGTAAVVTIPYWINFFLYMGLPQAQEVTDGLGTMDYGHGFRLLQPFSVVFDYIFYLVIGWAVYWTWWRESERTNRPQALLYWVFLAAMFVAWNVQVVVGYVPQPDHWLRAMSVLLFVIGLHLLSELSRRFNYRIIVLVLVIASGFLVVKKIVNVALFINPPEQILADYAFNPAVVDSWQWINQNLSGEPVVVSPSFVSSLYFTTETAVRPYLATRYNSSVANAVLEDRFLKTFKAFGVSGDMVERLLRSDPKELCGRFVDCTIPNTNDTQNWLKVPRNLYGTYYRNQIGPDAPTVFRYVTEAKVTELVNRYRVMPTVSFADLEADYIYYGPWERQFVKIDLSHNQDLVLLYTNPEVELYQIKK